MSDLTEAAIRDRLLEHLRPVVHRPLLIDKEVPVPYKHIYIPPGRRSDNPRLEVWCFKQDIVIYRRLFDKTVGHREAYVSKAGQPLVDVVLEKDNAQRTHDVGLPFVIIETKKQQPNTHDILTYSQKSQMIKTIFPYCRFVLLIRGRIAARTYRHGINFDSIIPFNDTSDMNEIATLRRTVKVLLSQATGQIAKLREPSRTLLT
jgi:hypothetical protein